MSALMALQMSGGATRGEKVRIWRAGEWHETVLRSLTISPHRNSPSYSAKVRKLMDQGQAAISARRWEEVAALMLQVIDLAPRAYEAFNNLAAALDELGDAEGSRAALEQALAIWPKYLYARVNLAIKTARQDAAAAAAYLEPLQEQTEFTPDEFALYQYGMARVAFARADYAAARAILNTGLSVVPDYKPALDLLGDIDAREFSLGVGQAANELKEYLQERDASYRQRQQKKLKTLSPAVDDIIGLYSADLLRPIARALAPERKLTGLRKADLQHLVRDLLLEGEVLSFVVHQQLRAVERDALQAVLAAGGSMPLEQFRQNFGDDAEESPWWHYHQPTSIGGRLRLHSLLVETSVKGGVYVAVPLELREPLARLMSP
jgi:tetratricopeptide (TPR) repeat protein